MLLARPWSETSLLVDVFTHQYGRFRLLAKGARRPKTGQRALLQAFLPLNISWAGKRGLPIMTGVESRQYRSRLRGEKLASAYYMSELLFKFLHANDPHERLFDAYEQALELLTDQNTETALRCFECSLLFEIGYGLQLFFDANDRSPIEANQRYFYHPEKGPIRTQDTNHDSSLNVSGQTIIALSQGSFDSALVQKESKRLLRVLLARQLTGQSFNTRKVYAQMLKMPKS